MKYLIPHADGMTHIPCPELGGRRLLPRPRLLISIALPRVAKSGCLESSIRKWTGWERRHQRGRARLRS